MQIMQLHVLLRSMRDQLFLRFLLLLLHTLLLLLLALLLPCLLLVIPSPLPIKRLTQPAITETSTPSIPPILKANLKLKREAIITQLMVRSPSIPSIPAPQQSQIYINVVISICRGPLSRSTNSSPSSSLTPVLCSSLFSSGFFFSVLLSSSHSLPFLLHHLLHFLLHQQTFQLFLKLILQPFIQSFRCMFQKKIQKKRYKKNSFFPFFLFSFFPFFLFPFFLFPFSSFSRSLIEAWNYGYATALASISSASSSSSSFSSSNDCTLPASPWPDSSLDQLLSIHASLLSQSQSQQPSFPSFSSSLSSSPTSTTLLITWYLSVLVIVLTLLPVARRILQAPAFARFFNTFKDRMMSLGFSRFRLRRFAEAAAYLFSIWLIGSALQLTPGGIGRELLLTAAALLSLPAPFLT